MRISSISCNPGLEIFKAVDSRSLLSRINRNRFIVPCYNIVRIDCRIESVQFYGNGISCTLIQCHGLFRIDVLHRTEVILQLDVFYGGSRRQDDRIDRSGFFASLHQVTGAIVGFEFSRGIGSIIWFCCKRKVSGGTPIDVCFQSLLYFDCDLSVFLVESFSPINQQHGAGMTEAIGNLSTGQRTAVAGSQQVDDLIFIFLCIWIVAIIFSIDIQFVF